MSKKLFLNFNESFRANAVSLLESEIASGRLDPAEKLKLQCALTTRTESEALSFANALATRILSRRIAVDHIVIERVSSEIDWWDYELFAYSGDEVVAKFASDHLVAIAYALDERGVSVGDNWLGIFSD